MKTLTTLFCAALAIGSALYAQSSSDHIIVELKNPIMVGDTRLPAGKCDIQATRGSSDTTVLVLRMENGPSVAAVVSRISTSDTGAGDDASLVFNRRGNDLHLSRVMFGERIGYQLPGVE
jgi:hypothetical protein